MGKCGGMQHDSMRPRPARVGPAAGAGGGGVRHCAAVVALAGQARGVGHPDLHLPVQSRPRPATVLRMLAAFASTRLQTHTHTFYICTQVRPKLEELIANISPAVSMSGRKSTRGSGGAGDVSDSDGESALRVKEKQLTGK